MKLETTQFSEQFVWKSIGILINKKENHTMHDSSDPKNDFLWQNIEKFKFLAVPSFFHENSIQ